MAVGEAKRVLIVSLTTGAGVGHVRAGQALEEAIRQAHPQVEVRHLEAMSLANPAFRWLVSGAYRLMLRRFPWLWRRIYASYGTRPQNGKLKRLTAAFDRLNAHRLATEARRFAPDRIVCTHHGPAELLAREHRAGKIDAPLYMVVTDYDPHVMWLQDGVDAYLVPTESVGAELAAKATCPTRTVATGIPIVPAFAADPPDKAAMRHKLGLAHRPVVLVVSGAFGMDSVPRTVAILANELADVQLLAVAGKSQRSRRALEPLAASHRGSVVPFGFVDNMHELMAASDLAVTKCGGLISSECLAMGLPMLIVSPIPGQEERNADHVVQHGAGVRGNPADLASDVARLLADREGLDRMAAAGRHAARPRAAFDIVEHVLGHTPADP